MKSIKIVGLEGHFIISERVKTINRRIPCLVIYNLPPGNTARLELDVTHAISVREEARVENESEYIVFFLFLDHQIRDDQSIYIERI